MVGYMNDSHETGSNLNISPKMSYGVLECDILLQNYMLMKRSYWNRMAPKCNTIGVLTRRQAHRTEIHRKKAR